MDKLIIQCPGCGAETSLSLDEPTYEGPFRCWKCRGAFLVIIASEGVISCKAISEEELKEYSK